MPGQHATLSPSASDRWISCPASIRMTREYADPKDDRGSSYAMEGTLAHTLGELTAALHFGLTNLTEYNKGIRKWRADFEAENYPEGTEKEMKEHVASYVQFIAQRMLRYPNSRLKLEQRLDTGVPGSWGTSDVVIYSPCHVEIIDLKYGMGIPVDATENSQLRLYACGALDAFGDVLDTTEEVYITVFQPRLYSNSTEVMHPDDLRAWRDKIAIPKALETQSPNASFGPSAKACRFCPVAAICKVRMQASVEEDFGPLAAEEPKALEVLTVEEISQILPRLEQIRRWADAVADYAHDLAKTTPGSVPGWKLVRSGGKRSITDPQGIIKALVDEMGRDIEEVAITEPKPKPIGALEKLIGKKLFAEKLSDYVTKGAGSESLVPEDDKREAINPLAEAIADFTEET